MRRLFGILGNWLLVVLFAGCAFFFYLLLRSPKLGQGESYTFYLGESSSARAVTARSPLAKLFLGEVKGESAVYRGDCYEELVQKYGAKLLFTERAGGATSYYLYSPGLGGGVSLGGQRVNLQIAVRDGQTVAGTPLIFGGW